MSHLNSLAVTLAVLPLLAGCPEPVDPMPHPLEIGRLDPADGTFHVLSDGDSMPVLLGANGLNMIVPSVRAIDVNPNRPNPDVQVEVGGYIMAAILEAERVPMDPDVGGNGFVLGNLQTPFDAELCCYVCTEGTVTATLRDASGRLFEGQVTVRLERGGCPDVTACCMNASDCEDPSLTQLCM